jgi:hypothetical protein
LKNPNQDQDPDKIPAIQKLFDRPFLWLTVGFITMLAFYTLWGLWEIYRLPPGTLP